MIFFKKSEPGKDINKLIKIASSDYSEPIDVLDAIEHLKDLSVLYQYPKLYINCERYKMYEESIINSKFISKKIRIKRKLNMKFDKFWEIDLKGLTNG